MSEGKELATGMLMLSLLVLAGATYRSLSLSTAVEGSPPLKPVTSSPEQSGRQTQATPSRLRPQKGNHQ